MIENAIQICWFSFGWTLQIELLCGAYKINYLFHIALKDTWFANKIFKKYLYTSVHFSDWLSMLGYSRGTIKESILLKRTDLFKRA